MRSELGYFGIPKGSTEFEARRQFRNFEDMKKRGFTLVEMLVAIGVILVLAVVGIPVGASCIENAKAAKEIAGGRNLVSAWMSYAADNNGSVLPGYLSMSQATAAKVTNKNGSQLVFPTSARYPFRLAPYLDYQLKGNILINKQVGLVDDYEISMAPSLGLNLTFVGGDFGGGSDLVPNDANYAMYGKFVVTNINEIYAPSKLLVFASAGRSSTMSTTATWMLSAETGGSVSPRIR